MTRLVRASVHDRSLSREQVRQLDRRAADEFGLATLVLMENAGRGVADLWTQLNWPAPVIICCGVGNNGGDGLVAARHLQARNVEVCVAMFGSRRKLTAETAANLRVVERSGIALAWFADAGPELEQCLRPAASVIDALLGIGATGAVRPPLDEVIEQINSRGVPILAVDLPSGLDCDTGVPAPTTIQATATCTFVAPKCGFAAAAELLGDVYVADIGAPKLLVDEIALNEHRS